MNENLSWPNWSDAVLLLEDGSVFFGNGFGVKGIITGELCFNTSMSGYQEIMTDPSYCGQIVVFTFPHIGNIGTNNLDCEAEQIFLSGIITGEIPTSPSNWRSEFPLHTWLEDKKTTAIGNIDTRVLTQHLRKHGAQNAIICFAKEEKPSLDSLFSKLTEAPDMAGQDLAKEVTCNTTYIWEEGRWDSKKNHYKTTNATQNSPHVVVVDFGVKKNILRELSHIGFKVTVVPCTSSIDDILSYNPDGVFLSNGPGDPAATGVYAASVVQELLTKDIPIFGICLGHQILSLAFGAKTEKMLFGHRGANHPVKNITTGKVEITSQNHGFCVVANTLPKTVKETHISLFDNSNEGLALLDKPVFSVQHHPEASPGPQDSTYLFNKFFESIQNLELKCLNAKI